MHLPIPNSSSAGDQTFSSSFDGIGPARRSLSAATAKLELFARSVVMILCDVICWCSTPTSSAGASPLYAPFWYVNPSNFVMEMCWVFFNWWPVYLNARITCGIWGIVINMYSNSLHVDFLRSLMNACLNHCSNQVMNGVPIIRFMFQSCLCFDAMLWDGNWDLLCWIHNFSCHWGFFIAFGFDNYISLVIMLLFILGPWILCDADL